MVEVKDGKKILTTPVSAEDLADIQIGDIIYLNGDMTTCRDVAHRRLVEEGRELPFKYTISPIFIPLRSSAEIGVVKIVFPLILSTIIIPPPNVL